MSAIIQLDVDHEKSFEEVMKYLKKARFSLAVRSFQYIAVTKNESQEIVVDPQKISKELYDASKGKISNIDTTDEDRQKNKPIANIIMSFSRFYSAEAQMGLTEKWYL